MIETPPQEVLGWWAGGIATGVLVLQRIWQVFRKERVEGHKANAEIDILAALQRRAEDAEGRADRAEQRTADAYRELNSQMTELGTLRGEVAGLRREVADLRRRIGDPAT